MTKGREAKETLKGLGLTDVKANLFMGFLLNFWFHSWINNLQVFQPTSFSNIVGHVGKTCTFREHVWLHYWEKISLSAEQIMSLTDCCADPINFWDPSVTPNLRVAEASPRGPTKSTKSTYHPGGWSLPEASSSSEHRTASMADSSQQFIHECTHVWCLCSCCSQFLRAVLSLVQVSHLRVLFPYSLTYTPRHSYLHHCTQSHTLVCIFTYTAIQFHTSQKLCAVSKEQSRGDQNRTRVRPSGPHQGFKPKRCRRHRTPAPASPIKMSV